MRPVSPHSIKGFQNLNFSIFLINFKIIFKKSFLISNTMNDTGIGLLIQSRDFNQLFFISNTMLVAGQTHCQIRNLIQQVAPAWMVKVF